MSDEVVKRPDEEKCDTNAEESPRTQAVEDGGESTEPKKKFSVLKVKFGPEPSGDTNGEDSNESPPPSSPIKSPQTPDMYTTNEAIPMTIFYRSQHSHGHGGKQRPTLQQLRKGLENDKVWTNLNDLEWSTVEERTLLRFSFSNLRSYVCHVQCGLAFSQIGDEIFSPVNVFHFSINLS